MTMKIALVLLACMPARAWAVEGATVFNGPDVAILESVARDFPRYDLGALCREAMPGTGLSAEAARATCKTQQGRLAGLVSNAWNQLPPAARQGCVGRADRASGNRYSVLYSCVNAVSFRVRRKDTIDRVAEKIARQNGKRPDDTRQVGSIR